MSGWFGSVKYENPHTRAQPQFCVTLPPQPEALKQVEKTRTSTEHLEICAEPENTSTGSFQRPVRNDHHAQCLDLFRMNSEWGVSDGAALNEEPNRPPGPHRPVNCDTHGGFF